MSALTDLIDIQLLLSARTRGMGAFHEADNMLLGIGKAVATFGLVAGAALAGAAVISTQWAAEFERDLTLIHTQAGDTSADLHRIGSDLEQMATQVGMGPDELAKSLYHVESAGFRGKEAMDMVRMSAELAQVGQADLEKTTQAVIGSLAAFGDQGLTASDAVAILNATVGAGDMRMEGLASAMSTGVLPAARVMGLGLVDVGAALATLTDNATPPEEAATRLRMTFSMLGAPTHAAQKALASIGLTATQLATDMHKPNGLLVAITDLKGHLEGAGMTAEQQAQVIARAFGGGRSSAAIETLLSEFDRFKEKYHDINEGAHGFAKAWEETQKTVSFKQKQMQADIKVMGTVFGAALLPIATDIMSAILPAMQQFAVFMAGPGSKAMEGFGSHVHQVGQRLGGMLSDAKNARNAQEAFAVVLLDLGVKFKDVSRLTHIFMDAQKAFGPILRDVTKVIKQFAADHKAEFKEIYETAKQILEALEELVSAILKAIAQFWKDHGEQVLNFVKADLQILTDIVKIALHLIVDIIHLVTDIIKGNWKGAWGDVVQILKDAIGGIFNLLGDLTRLTMAALDFVSHVMQDIFNHMKDAVIGIFQALFDALVGHSIIPELVTKIIEHFGRLPGEIIRIILDLDRQLFDAAIHLGQSIVNGITNGLANAKDQIGGSLKNIAQDALNTAKSVLGISSPSRVFAEQVGKPIAEGIGQGILAARAHPLGALGAVTGALAAGGGGGRFAFGAAGGGGQSVVIDLRGSHFTSRRAFEDLKEMLDKELVQKLVPAAGINVRR